MSRPAISVPTAEQLQQRAPAASSAARRRRARRAGRATVGSACGSCRTPALRRCVRAIPGPSGDAVREYSPCRRCCGRCDPSVGRRISSSSRRWSSRTGSPTAARSAARCSLLAAFCAAASAIYLINDLRDREEDRHHPLKRQRPIASGAVGAGHRAVRRRSSSPPRRCGAGAGARAGARRAGRRLRALNLLYSTG